MKLSDYVIRWGKDRPDHAFLSLDGKTITYGEADAFTKGKGESLPEEVHGKVVALYLTDPASQVLWFLAVEEQEPFRSLSMNISKEKDSRNSSMRARLISS